MAIVIGASAGGIKLLTRILPMLPMDFPQPIFVAQHVPSDLTDDYIQYIDSLSLLKIKEANHNEAIKPNHVYFAPAGYHLLIENKDYLSLSIDHLVNYARPSIDVLFQSAAEVFQSNLIGIILTGANRDGVEGARRIKQLGGTVLAQTPQDANMPIMPEAVITALDIPKENQLPADMIIEYLLNTRHKDA